MLNPSVLTEYALKAAVSIVVGGFITMLLWPLRRARTEWITLKEEQGKIYAELVTQRTNCLTTLAQQGDRQIELLGEVAGTLTGMALSQAEMTGYCKANTGCGPLRRRRTAKK